MSQVLFGQTLRDKALGATIIAILLFIFMVYVCYMYSQVRQMTGIQDMLNNPAIQALIGKTATLATFEGFLTLFSFSYLGLIVGGYISFVTASFLAGEIEGKTIDLLLSLPIRREMLVLWRYAVLVPIVILLMLVVFAAIYIGASAAGLSTDMVWIGYALAYIGLFALAFGAVSLLLSALLSDGRLAALLSLAVLFAMYFAETIGETVPSLDPVRRISLFHYVDSQGVIVGHSISAANVLILIAAMILFLALAAFAFRHKDINVT
ncbi:MAG TPA: ABC transporter permease subunit [Methanocella sp.]|nr:ABC transporter permease subunit [Methanocella sp.]